VTIRPSVAAAATGVQVGSAMVATRFVTIFLALSPITAAILGALLLAETVSAISWLGLVCVGLGLWLAHRPDARQPGQTTEPEPEIPSAAQ
jgi:drug/metabolite transporter (DMT)-like permease